MLEVENHIKNMQNLHLFSLPDEILGLMIKFKLKNEPYPFILGKNEVLKFNYFHLFSKNGIGDIGGTTEIILINQPKGSLRIGTKILVHPSPNESVQFAETHNIPNILFIYFFDLDDKEKANLINSIEYNPSRVKIHVWNISDITEYLGYNPFIPLDFYRNLLENLEDSQDILNDFQEDSIETLRIKYGEISLFLGAGVSKQSNIPSWDKLINNITSEIYSELLKNKLSPDEIQLILSLKSLNAEESGEIGTIIGNSHQIESSVFKYLYNDDFLNIIKKALYGEISDIPLNSPLLSEIVNFCVPRKFGQTDTFDGVNTIITYNYDNILEQHFSLKGDDKYHVLSNKKDIHKSDCVNIYHVHGFIPFNDQRSSNISDIILSSEDYHRLYNEMFNWSNMCQITQLRAKTCLFIGISFRDPNIRRLLSLIRITIQYQRIN